MDITAMSDRGCIFQCTVFGFETVFAAIREAGQVEINAREENKPN